MAKLLFFDTETTGFTPGQIAQLSMIIEDDREVHGENYFFEIDYISQGAEELLGRGVDFYKEVSKGQRFKDVSTSLYDKFKDAILVAHNEKFDENFISTEFWRENIVFKPYDKFCTMEYFKDILKIPATNKRYGKYKNPKLEEVVNYLCLDEAKIEVYEKQIFNMDINENGVYHDARFDTTSMYVAFHVYKDLLRGTKDWVDVFCKK